MPTNPYEPPRDESVPPRGRSRLSVRTFFSVSVAITLLNALVASQVEQGNDASLFFVLFNLPVTVAVTLVSLSLARPLDDSLEYYLVVIGGGLMWARLPRPPCMFGGRFRGAEADCT